MAVSRVETPDQVVQLVSGLFSTSRTVPWVVVSIAEGSTRPAIDAHEIAAAVHDVAEIFTVPTGELTFQLGDLLPERLQVYGGAGRSYPVGFTTDTAPSESRLRFPHDKPDRAKEQLIADALGQAHAAGLFATSKETSRPAAGIVSGFLLGGERALVTLDTGGGHATIWQEVTYPPVPLNWTLREGQRIEGCSTRRAAASQLSWPRPPCPTLRRRFRTTA